MPDLGSDAKGAGPGQPARYLYTQGQTPEMYDQSPEPAPKPSAVLLPTYGDVMAPVVVALQDLGESASPSRLTEWVAENVRFWKPFDRQPKHRRVENLGSQVRQALTTLKRSGVVTNPSRGVWAITEKGRRTTFNPPSRWYPDEGPKS